MAEVEAETEAEVKEAPKRTPFTGRTLVLVAVVIAVMVVALSTAFTELGSGVIAGATVVYAGLTYFLVKHTEDQAKISAAGLEAQRVALEQQYEAVRTQINAAAQQVEEAAKSNTVAAEMHEETVKGRLDPFAPRVTVQMVDRSPTVVEVRRDKQQTEERPSEVVMGQDWHFHIRWNIEVVNYGDLPVKMWVTGIRVPPDEQGHQVLPPLATKEFPLDYFRTAHPARHEMIKFLLQFTDVQNNITDTHLLQFWPPMFREDHNVLRIDWAAKANVVPIAQVTRAYLYVHRKEREKQEADEQAETDA